MHKVRYTEPKPVTPRDHGSYDPGRYMARTQEGYLLELEPEPVIIHKDVRGFWSIVDPGTGLRVDSVRLGYKTRKEAIAAAQDASVKLHAFKVLEASRDHYAKLAQVTEVLAHELAVIESAGE